MAKTTAPLLSFGASGAIAKTLVYAKWKGREYSRRYTVPSNPQSVDQMLTRNTFSWLQQAFKLAPPLAVEPWTAYALGKVMSDRNAWNKFNIGPIRAGTDLSDIILSPGALGGLSPSAFTPTGGNDQITTSVTGPTTLPTGWTAYSAVVACVLDQDPHVDTDYQIYAAEDLTVAYAPTLTGLPAGDYRVAAWMKQTRPDGRIAFSPAMLHGSLITVT